MKISKVISMSILTLALGSFSFADEAYDVMKKSTTLQVPDFTTSEMFLDNIDKNGKLEEHQVMQQYGTRSQGLIYTVFDFKTSTTNKGTRVLQMEKTAKDDDRWVYLPSLRTTRRIPTSDRYKSFVGCEFTYNDMSIRHVDLDNHVMMNANESLTVNGNTLGGNFGTTTYNCYKIDSTPSSPESKRMVEYSHRISYIDKNTYLPVKVEYYDKKDSKKLMKHLLLEKIENVTSTTGKSYVLRRSCLITNDLTGRSTRVSVGKLQWDKPVSMGFFTQNWLTTGKAK